MAPASLRIAIQIGFVTLLGAMVTGALMIAKGMLLVFSGDPQAVYATGGATHAVTMHAILILPLLACLVSLTKWSEQRRLRLVLLAAAGYVVIAAGFAVENFSGLELRQSPAAVVVFFLVGTLACGGQRIGPRRGRKGFDRRSRRERELRPMSAG